MQAAIYSSASHVSKAFQAFLAASACQSSATSYHSCSAAPLSWPSAFSWAAHVFKAGRSLLAFGSNSAVKRTASPPLTLAVRQFSLYSRQMRNFVLIASAALLLSACASPARYAWVKGGASDHQRTNDTSECTYQVRLNKTPAAEQKELHSLCMQGKGYRLKRVG